MENISRNNLCLVKGAIVRFDLEHKNSGKSQLLNLYIPSSTDTVSTKDLFKKLEDDYNIDLSELSTKDIDFEISKNHISAINKAESSRLNIDIDTKSVKRGHYNDINETMFNVAEFLRQDNSSYDKIMSNLKDMDVSVAEHNIEKILDKSLTLDLEKGTVKFGKIERPIKTGSFKITDNSIDFDSVLDTLYDNGVDVSRYNQSMFSYSINTSDKIIKATDRSNFKNNISFHYENDIDFEKFFLTDAKTSKDIMAALHDINAEIVKVEINSAKDIKNINAVDDIVHNMLGKNTKTVINGKNLGNDVMLEHAKDVEI